MTLADRALHDFTQGRGLNDKKPRLIAVVEAWLLDQGEDDAVSDAEQPLSDT